MDKQDFLTQMSLIKAAFFAGPEQIKRVFTEVQENREIARFMEDANETVADLLNCSLITDKASAKTAYQEFKPAYEEEFFWILSGELYQKYVGGGVRPPKPH